MGGGFGLQSGAHIMPYADKAKNIACMRKWYQDHKAEIKLRSKKWAENNKQRVTYIKKAWTARRKLYDAAMTLDVVQSVYEANIKKYGTLTCIVCGKAIKFGEDRVRKNVDTLEHIIPLSRGGTHDFDNLGVSHLSCNSKKHDKTLKEYKGA